MAVPQLPPFRKLITGLTCVLFCFTLQPACIWRVSCSGVPHLNLGAPVAAPAVGALCASLSLCCCWTGCTTVSWVFHIAFPPSSLLHPQSKYAALPVSRSLCCCRSLPYQPDVAEGALVLPHAVQTLLAQPAARCRTSGALFLLRLPIAQLCGIWEAIRQQHLPLPPLGSLSIRSHSRICASATAGPALCDAALTLNNKLRRRQSKGCAGASRVFSTWLQCPGPCWRSPRRPC